jgi:hypothetical protein
LVREYSIGGMDEDENNVLAGSNDKEKSTNSKQVHFFSNKKLMAIKNLKIL